MINNRFNVVYHLLGLVKLLFYKLKIKNMKLYESENQIVIRGINHELIKEHLDSDIQKVLCIYDTYDNLLKDLREYNSRRLALYQILDCVEDEWIIERHKRLDNEVTSQTDLINKPWGIMENPKQ
jgi:hypothetical protein